SFFVFFFYSYIPLLTLHSFPTRRSSDLAACRAVHFSAGSSHFHFKTFTAPECTSKAHGSLIPLWLARTRRGPTDGGTCQMRKSRSEEHTSELQSRFDLVCRLLLEKKNNI